MRVLVLGAGGFIGSRLVACLLREGRGRPPDQRAVPVRPVRAAGGGRRAVSRGQRAWRPARSARARPAVRAPGRRGVPPGRHADAGGRDRFPARHRDQRAGVHRAAGAPPAAGVGAEVGADAAVRQLHLHLRRRAAGGGGRRHFPGPGHVVRHGTRPSPSKLLADYSRNGFAGRALRLPIVVTHPGPASGSISALCRVAVARAAARPAGGLPYLHAGQPHGPGLGGQRDRRFPAAGRAAGRCPAGGAHHEPARSPSRRPSWSRRCAAGLVPMPAPSSNGAPTPRSSASSMAGRGSSLPNALALGIRPDADADALVDAFLSSESTRP